LAAGHIAKTRGHPWADAVTVAGWITLICGFALWPIALIWAYVDVPRGIRRSITMIVAISASSSAAVRAGEGFTSSALTCSGRYRPFASLCC